MSAPPPPRPLKSVIAAALEIDPAGLDDAAGIDDTENWTSLTQFMVIAAVELEYGARFSFSQLEAATTLHSISELLRRQGIAAAG